MNIFYSEGQKFWGKKAVLHLEKSIEHAPCPWVAVALNFAPDRFAQQSASRRFSRRVICSFPVY